MSEKGKRPNPDKRPRGRPLAVKWQHSEEELYEHFRQEKQWRIRTRLHALWLLRKGKSMTEVSQVLDINYRTLQRWLAWYGRGSLGEVVRRTVGGQRREQPGYLSAEQEEELRARADAGHFHTAQEAADWLEAQWGIQYRPGSIYSVFRRMGIGKKVPRRQAEQADEGQQAAWKKGGLPAHSEQLASDKET